MFSEVTAKHPFPQDAAFLQLTPGRAGQDETPGERDGAKGRPLQIGVATDLKNVMSFPCFLSTGFVGSLGESDWSEFLRVRWGRVLEVWGRVRPWGTLSPITSTHSQGKKPTSKPLFPLHHMDSSGPGMSITEIMSPT